MSSKGQASPKLRKVTAIPGFVYAILAATLFGASTPAAKGLLNGTSPWLLAGLLYLGSGFGLAGVRLGTKLLGRGGHEVSLRRGDWLWFAGSIFFGGVLAPALLMFGLSHSDAAAGSLLLNIEAVFTATLAWFVFKEKFDRRLVLGMVAVVAGSLVLSWTGTPKIDELLGPACVTGACLAWAIDNNLTKKISDSDPLQISMIKGLISGVTNTLLAILVGSIWPAGAMILGALAVGFLGYGISLVCFVLSLRHIGAARTGAYFSVAPFVGAGIALAMGAPLTWQIVVAGILMVAGLWLLYRSGQSVRIETF